MKTLMSGGEDHVVQKCTTRLKLFELRVLRNLQFIQLSVVKNCDFSRINGVHDIMSQFEQFRFCKVELSEEMETGRKEEWDPSVPICCQ